MDTEPSLQVPVETMLALLSMVPHWSAYVLGPVPFGQTNRVEYHASLILRETREEALAVVWSHIQVMCESLGHPFDPFEWDVDTIEIVGGN